MVELHEKRKVLKVEQVLATSGVRCLTHEQDQEENQEITYAHL